MVTTAATVFVTRLLRMICKFLKLEGKQYSYPKMYKIYAIVSFTRFLNDIST